MRPKITILFNFMEFLFVGEVIRHTIDGVSVYNVSYTLAANPEYIDELEIYRGSGPDKRVYWRQRFTKKETVVADPDLVTIIGKAIKIQEDIELR